MALNIAKARAAGFTDSQIDEYLENQEAAKPQGPVYRTSTGEALWEGAKQGATLGFADELTGALAAGGRIEGPDYEAARDAAREQLATTQEEHGLAALGGEILGGVGPGGTVLSALRGGARTLPALGRALARPGAASGVAGAALGGGYGAGTSEAETPGGVAVDALGGAVLGAVAGPGLEGGAATLGAIGRGAGGVLERAGRTLQSPTSGMDLEGIIEMLKAQGLSPGAAANKAAVIVGRDKGLAESLTGPIKDIGGMLAEESGKSIKSIGEKISKLPQKWRGQFEGSPGNIKDAQRDFKAQATDRSYREASREATSTVPTPRQEALGRLRGERRAPESPGAVMRAPSVNTGLPPHVPVPETVSLGAARTQALEALDSQPIRNTGLPPGTPGPTIVTGGEPLREEVLARIASSGKLSSDPSLASYLKATGRPSAEQNRTPFDVTFTKRGTGEERELTGHLGISKYVLPAGTGGRGREDAFHNLITAWEPAQLTQEARGVRKMIGEMKDAWKASGKKLKDFPEIDEGPLKEEIRAKLTEIRALESPSIRREALANLLGKFEGSLGYRRLGVEAISKLRPGSKRGPVEYRFEPAEIIDPGVIRRVVGG